MSREAVKDDKKDVGFFDPVPKSSILSEKDIRELNSGVKDMILSSLRPYAYADDP